MTSARTTLAQHRITRLASMLAVHRAFHWLHLHEPQLRLWQLEMLAIPAPPFAEAARARWFYERFQSLGMANVHIDDEGNVLAELPSQGKESANLPFLLLSAHLDTVFPQGTDTRPREEESRILAPGACDNGAGLTGLLAMAAALRFAGIDPPPPILFAANVGEEGEGDLRGMRHLFTCGAYRKRIGAALALEGSGTATAVTRALGSLRFRATLAGPGGHSWTDAQMPNPITLLCRAVASLADHFADPSSSTGARTTFSPGQISGGTSINSIPQSASVLLDLRCTDANELEHHGATVERIFRHMTSDISQRFPQTPMRLDFTSMGRRPAAALSDESPLLDTLRAVDRHLGLRTELRLGSTDANLPLSLGIPAAALAAGGTGGGIHTLAEWYDPSGREVALRRILLTLLDLAQSPGMQTASE